MRQTKKFLKAQNNNWSWSTHRLCLSVHHTQAYRPYFRKECSSSMIKVGRAMWKDHFGGEIWLLSIAIKVMCFCHTREQHWIQRNLPSDENFPKQSTWLITPYRLNATSYWIMYIRAFWRWRLKGQQYTCHDIEHKLKKIKSNSITLKSMGNAEHFCFYWQVFNLIISSL